MPYFPSLPDDAGVRHILQLNPAAGRALVELHIAALRNPSALAASEKELLAAYVSALNACQYCYGVHSETAKAFGIEADLLGVLIADPATAPVDAKLKPVLAYAQKLTLSPARMTQTDADAVFAAGWSEEAFHDAVLTVCLFNFMNRLVEGHGVKGSAEVYVLRGKALRDEGYAPLLEALKPVGS
jgi:uncharacterized peroxidase-related enzyme